MPPPFLVLPAISGIPWLTEVSFRLHLHMACISRLCMCTYMCPHFFFLWLRTLNHMASSNPDYICKDCAQMRSHLQEQKLELKTTSPLSPATTFGSNKAKASIKSAAIKTLLCLSPPPRDVPGSAYSSSFRELWLRKCPANHYVTCTLLMTFIFWHTLATHQYFSGGNRA